MHPPKVSVLIPTYNYAHFIGEAIESVLTQTFTDFELIILDDASTDNTDDVVAQYLHDPRIQYYKNDKNLGLVGNWNKALDLATGEYIKILCADDKFRPTLLERFVAVMDEHKQVTLVVCNREVFGGASKILTLPLKHYQKGRDMINSTINSWDRIGEPTSTMFRRSDLEKAGKFDPNKHQFIDLDVWIRLLTIGDCYIVPEALSYQRSHAGALTSANFRSNRFTFEDYELHRDLREGRGFTVDVSDMNINAAVRGKAALCAKVMYKMLPKLHEAESRQKFVRAFKIARKEGVLLAPLVAFIKRKVSGNKKKPATSPNL
jgi:glycosyltransferase involved in cell wall biosynthesis